MKTRSLYVYEYGLLKKGSGDSDLRDSEFDSLCRYFEKAGKRFYTIEHNKIRFKHYVGVIQIDNLTIEVLPKVDRDVLGPERWQEALVEMLRFTNKIRATSHDNVNLTESKATLIDLYFDQFLILVESLFKGGLKKKYHSSNANLHALKGRIIFNEHLKKNIVNKANFYCGFQDFTFDHKLHWAIKNALTITSKSARKDRLRLKAKNLLTFMPEDIEDKISIADLDSIILDRTTKRYEDALNYSSLIIKHYCPVMTVGQLPVLSFMFDMNQLFEEFIFTVMRRSLSDLGFEVMRKKKKFWKTKEIKPDLTISKGNRTIILDTKWKIPVDGLPSDADLKQVYVYNHFFDSPASILLYPWSGIFQDVSREDLYGTYLKPMSLNGLFIESSCRVETIKLFNESSRFDIELVKSSLRSMIIEIDNAVTLHESLMKAKA